VTARVEVDEGAIGADAAAEKTGGAEFAKFGGDTLGGGVAHGEVDGVEVEVPGSGCATDDGVVFGTAVGGVDGNGLVEVGTELIENPEWGDDVGPEVTRGVGVGDAVAGFGEIPDELVGLEVGEVETGKPGEKGFVGEWLHLENCMGAGWMRT